MTTKINLQNWTDQSIQSLGESEYPSLEVQVLLAHVLSTTREWVIAHPEFPLESDKIKELQALLLRLKNGEPLAYLIGKRSFYGLDFIVSPDVLIPRPETELLVEEAIRWLETNPNCRQAYDVGTGSGAIAITLADQFPDLHITAIDISDQALDIARQNSLTHHVELQISWLKNDLLTGIEKKANLIVANLPYIPSQKLEALDVLRYEPRLALDGGPDGLDLIYRLLEQADKLLIPGGLILLEIESTQGEKTPELAKKVFPAGKIALLFDFAKLPRLVKIQL